jgi:hypothetical protein
MTFDVTGKALFAFIVFQGALIIIFIVYKALDKRLTDDAEGEVWGKPTQAEREVWEQEIQGRTLPSYDGAQFGWPETGLAAYLDKTVQQPALVARPRPVFRPAPGYVPSSRVSGPLPTAPMPRAQLSAAEDADLTVAEMIARTDHFLAMLAAPLSV